MFHEWDSFYLLVGGGAGALIGTMFVVATLTASLDPSRASRGGQIYITPIVFHFTVVLVVSLMTAVPGLTVDAVGSSLTFLSLAGLIYTVATTYRIFNLDWGKDSPDWEDKCFYGIFPLIAYFSLLGSAAAVWLAPEDAPYDIAVVLVVILLIGIYDAWDLATTLAKTARERPN